MKHTTTPKQILYEIQKIDGVILASEVERHIEIFDRMVPSTIDLFMSIHSIGNSS